MYELERIAAVFKPTQLFLDWIREIPGEDNSDLELVDLREDCTTILIPAFNSPEEADTYIEELFINIFANELEGWVEDPAFWPQEPDFELFKSWFDIEYHSMVYDLVDEPDDDVEAGELAEMDYEDDDYDDDDFEDDEEHEEADK